MSTIHQGENTDATGSCTSRVDMGEILSAFEYMDRDAYTLSVKHGQGKALSEEEIKGAECFVLIETSGGNKEHDEEVGAPSIPQNHT